MALQKTVSLTNNFDDVVEIQNAYHKVTELRGNKDIITFDVQVSKTQDSKVLKTTTYDFEPAMNGDNFIKQAYLHLKTLDQFVGAIDA